MSPAATRPCSTAGSLIALGAICPFGIVITTKKFCAAIEDQEVPFGISRFATRTVPRLRMSFGRVLARRFSRRVEEETALQRPGE
jgi:hypothetical protein